MEALLYAAPAAADALDSVIIAQRPTSKHSAARAAARGGGKGEESCCFMGLWVRPSADMQVAHVDEKRDTLISSL